MIISSLLFALMWLVIARSMDYPKPRKLAYIAVIINLSIAATAALFMSGCGSEADAMKEVVEVPGPTITETVTPESEPESCTKCRCKYKRGQHE